jgi:hypothetical protein
MKLFVTRNEKKIQGRLPKQTNHTTTYTSLRESNVFTQVSVKQMSLHKLSMKQMSLHKSP